MGIFEDDRFSAGTFAVARAVCEATASGGKSIIGGGDSVKALNKAGLGDQVTFMSTGGGASPSFSRARNSPRRRTHRQQFYRMDKERKLIIAGNWKMNKTVAESLDLANGLVRELKEVKEWTSPSARRSPH